MKEFANYQTGSENYKPKGLGTHIPVPLRKKAHDNEMTRLTRIEQVERFANRLDVLRAQRNLKGLKRLFLDMQEAKMGVREVERAIRALEARK